MTTCLLAAAMCVVLVHVALRHRLGERRRPLQLPKSDEVAKKAAVPSAAVAPISSDTPPASVSPHVRSAGLMERWYLSQPVGEKRAFEQAIRVRSARGLSVRPTLHQLRCALSRVALAHPILLALPSPARDQLASQVTDSDVDSDGTLAFPLACIEECVDLADGPVESVLQSLINAPSDSELTAEEWSSRQSVGTKYRGVRLLLVRGDSDHEFELVLRLAHLIGDGLSGMMILRYVLCELADMRREDAPVLPTRVPVSSLRSIAEYPAMDDLIDCRPSMRRVLQHAWTNLSSKLKSSALKFAELPWRGRNLVADPDAIVPRGESRFMTVHLEAPEVTKLLSQARANGVTLQAVLNTTMLVAAGVVSGQQSVRLDYTTPVSTRERCEKGDAASHAAALRPSQLIGNFLVGHMESVTLDEASPACSSVTSSSRLRDDFWQISRSYLARLRNGMSHALETNGLIGLIDISAFIAARAARAWRRRDSSIATSNLGCVDVGPSAVFDAEFRARTNDDLQLERVWFTQGAAYVGTVFSASIVACARGGLTASVSYPTTVVSDEAARTFEQSMRDTLQQILQA